MNFRTIIPCFLYYLLSVALFIETAQSSECNERYSIILDNVCMVYKKEVTDWFGAKKLCLGLGMQLASVDTKETIQRFYSDLNLKSYWAIWVGANDLKEEGKFVWDDDQTPVSDNAWLEGEPDQKAIEEDCAYVNSMGLLVEVPCNSSCSTLCMYQMSPSSELVSVDNNLICHCANGSCYSNGTCRGEDDRCASGWFGPRCQFRSLSGDKQGPLGALADNDDNTCTSELPIRLDIKLNKGSIFTWLRITVNKSDELGGFKLFFRIHNLKVACHSMRVLPVKERTVDIICHEGPFIVDEVIISWSGHKTLCSVVVNGEQNVAFLQNTSFQEKQESVNGSMLPVDGRKGPRDRCFIGQPKEGHQKWTMTFNTPKVVNEIIIYRRLRPEGYAFMNTFYVKCYDAKNDLLFHYNDTGGNSDKPAVWILTRVNVPMKQIVIGLEKANETLHLELCEVEAFGACAPPDYELFCDQTCDVSCSGQKCHHNGMCIVCAFGDSENGGCLSGAAVPARTTKTTLTTSQTTSTDDRGNVTNAAALNCTTPFVDTSESSQLVKLLIISCVCLAVMVLGLITYVVKRMQDKNDLGKEPVEDVEPSIHFSDDILQVKSEYSRPTISATSVTKSVTKDKSLYTVKTTTSGSTHIE